jgi:hypothetical protein
MVSFSGSFVKTLWKNAFRSSAYCKSPQNIELYDEAKEDSSKKVRQAQMRYEKEICQKAKDDPKVFWRFVQSKTKIKESIQCIIDDNGEIHTENKCKAELLNAFFQSVFTNEPGLVHWYVIFTSN